MSARPGQIGGRLARREALKLCLERHTRVGPERYGTRNDKGALLADALESIGLDAVDCVTIGDRHHDIAAARAPVWQASAWPGAMARPVSWRKRPPPALR